MSYAIDPTQPLPKRWKDKAGPIRVMTIYPFEGYVMARRTGAAPFVIRVRDLLGGEYDPILPKPKINVRDKVAAIRKADADRIRAFAHGEDA